MSRFTLICSLVLGLSSSALLAERAEAQFAAPPPAAASAPRAMPADVDYLAPRMAVTREAVRDALAKARATNLAAFRTYQQKGVFPNNTFKGQKLNVWRDADGNLCAAATLISTSGNTDLAIKVAEQNNFIKLADVTQGPLMDWILTSGFTQAEIAAIQEPFMPVSEEPSLEPEPPILVDAGMRAAENRRLRATYRKVDKQLVKNQRASLERATDLLMKKPDLAWRLVHGA